MSARIPPSRIGHLALSVTARTSQTPLSIPIRARLLSTQPSTTPATPSNLSAPTAQTPSGLPQNQDQVEKELLQKRYLDAQGIGKSKKERQNAMAHEGHLSNSTTIFKPEYEIQGFRDELPQSKKEAIKQAAEAEKARQEKLREKELAAAKLDPRPTDRLKIEKRLVMKSIKRRGRLTHAEELARTERKYRWASRDLPTTPKKLTRLMTMIQGKTVEEALVQLRFNPKRAAKDVIKGLIMARDTAIVHKGMGVGAASILPSSSTELTTKDTASETPAKDAEVQLTASQRKELELLLPNGTRRREALGAPTTIELKNGDTKQITDPTDIYIDRAWIGRGIMWKSIEPRARGQANILRHRTAKFFLILKEEKTRMRVSEEIKKKRDNRKLWTALPDRAVTAQRQYCLW